MVDNNDFKDFLKKFKDYFNIDTDMFDAEFFLFSDKDSDKKPEINSNNDNSFRISYHFENGMDKPDIKINGNIDDIDINEYLNNIDFSKIFNLNKKNNKQDLSLEIIDTEKLSVFPEEQKEELNFEEPHIEIYNSNDTIEILVDAPGIEKDDILITNHSDKKTIIFDAETKDKRYYKKIKLPSKISSILNDTVEVNNGIITFKCKKK